MEAINKFTGARITGTLERLLGNSQISEIRQDSSGRITFECEDGTDVNWDTGKTVVDDQGSRIFLDEDGEEVPEPSVAFVEPEKAAKLRQQTTATNNEVAIRKVIRMLRENDPSSEKTSETIEYLENYEQPGIPKAN